VARILIVGCGCRGRELARELVATGHVVRGTTRDPGRVPAIEEAGVEAAVCDPDRVGSFVDSGAIAGVTIACLLLGSASGDGERVAALHGTRLEMLLTKLIDTTVRGVLYEASGTVDGAVLEAGAAIVRDRCELSRIPCVVLEREPEPHGPWVRAGLAGVAELLGG
jgi:hypothetical protein